MTYRLRFFPYQRQLKKPLHTYHGTMTIREGIIIHLIDTEGRVGEGEIAPLPWFGSETMGEARDFCQGIGESISEREIWAIPENLGACQFAFESAWRQLLPPGEKASRELYFSHLLPAGKSALTACQGDQHCYKWKIGVYGLGEELPIFEKLLEILPESTQLRLDANGGLTLQEAKVWLDRCAGVEQIEFMEQPLGIGQLPQMLALAQEFTTPLALDESVANLRQLKYCYEQGWRSIFVIKPAIIGYPHLLRQFCQEYSLDTVFSSVFETAIARQACLQLAQEIMVKNRALGFGDGHWFRV